MDWEKAYVKIGCVYLKMYIIHLPATMILWFAVGVLFSVVAEHNTTVPLSPALAVNLNMETKSARPFRTILTLVSEAKKLRSPHSTDWTALQSRVLWPEVARNTTAVGSVRTGAAVHPTIAAWSTMHVYVTTSPEHACPTTLDVRVMVAGVLQIHNSTEVFVLHDTVCLLDVTHWCFPILASLSNTQTIQWIQTWN